MFKAEQIFNPIWVLPLFVSVFFSHKSIKSTSFYPTPFRDLIELCEQFVYLRAEFEETFWHPWLGTSSDFMASSPTYDVCRRRQCRKFSVRKFRKFGERHEVLFRAPNSMEACRGACCQFLLEAVRGRYSQSCGAYQRVQAFFERVLYIYLYTTILYISI